MFMYECMYMATLKYQEVVSKHLYPFVFMNAVTVTTASVLCYNLT